MAMVQLELDDKDKESFQEMQQSVGQAQQELQMVSSKLRTREQEGKLAALTLSELQSMDDSTTAYQQVGKMFLQKPMAELKQQLSDKVDGCRKELSALTEKKAHVEEALKKVNDDFQEFIKTHLVQQATAGSS
uniref:Prefoldin subunit 1 n=1 Tax=Calcidiscus leptoporus TaxID=127549 RepID=A0A7S0NZI9_9EUKA